MITLSCKWHWLQTCVFGVFGFCGIVSDVYLKSEAGVTFSNCPAFQRTHSLIWSYFQMAPTTFKRPHLFYLRFHHKHTIRRNYKLLHITCPRMLKLQIHLYIKNPQCSPNTDVTRQTTVQKCLTPEPAARIINLGLVMRMWMVNTC